MIRRTKKFGTEPSPSDIARITTAISPFSVISCDIFDTALMRTLARSEDVLLAVGARARKLGIVSCEPESFREYRIEAEASVRREALAQGHDEVRILEIYERMESWRLLKSSSQLAAVEFAVERSICQPIVPVRQLLKTLESEKRIIFLSDTILPGSWLAALLKDCGYGESCEVFSSSDMRHNKHTGQLFADVIETLKCRPSDIVHIGDNPSSDIKSAEQYGITALRIPWSNPPPQPDKIATAAWPVQLIHSRRRSRASKSQLLGVSDGALISPHRYLSTLLIGFSLFILAEARRRNVRKVYFFARDGYLPLEIVRRLVARTEESIELQYLHVSRQAVVLPMMGANISKLASKISESMLGAPLKSAFEFTGMSSETISRRLVEIGLDPNQKIVGESGYDVVQNAFAQCTELISSSLDERRAAALAYLDQCGFLATGPRLIVDVGWAGSIQSALSELTEIRKEDILGCYMGLLPRALEAGLDPRLAAGYLFSFGAPKPLQDMVLDGYGIFELFFSAPHGQTLYYVVNSHGAKPVLAEQKGLGAVFRKEFLKSIENGCIKEFEALDNVLDGAWPERIDPKSALSDIEHLLTRPMAHEVAAINRIPFVDLPGNSNCLCAVNPVSLHDFFLNLDYSIRRIEKSPWRAGAVRASMPWPLPDMSYRDFRHRVEKIRRILTGV